jgi:hypothetical protein
MQRIGLIILLLMLPVAALAQSQVRPCFDVAGQISCQDVSAANPLPVTSAPSSSPTIGLVPVVGGSAVSSQVLKASPGNLYSVYAECSSACWLMVFNATSITGLAGATTAGSASGNMVECIPISAGGLGGLNYAPSPPGVYSVGITAAISSTTCATLTLSGVGFIHGLIN